MPLVGSYSKHNLIAIIFIGLIDERRTQQSEEQQQQQHVRSLSEAYYGDVQSPTTNSPSTVLLTPMEVQQQSNSMQQESLLQNAEGVNFFFNNATATDYPLLSYKISLKSVAWIIYLSGMIGMSFLNPLCCVLAMKYANPSILAPFSGLTLVWVVLFSGNVLGEYPGRSQKVACGLIVMGEVLVAMFGDHTNGEDAGVEDVVS